MKMSLSPVVVIAVLVPSAAQAQAQAQAPARPWSLSVTGSTSSAADDQATTSGQVSLDYDTGKVRVGASLGATRANTQVPSVLNVVNASSVDGAAFLGTQVDGFDLSASFGYSRQALDATATARPDAPAVLAGRSVRVGGATTATTYGAGVSRSFGSQFTVTPSLNVAYGRTREQVDLSLASGLGNTVSTVKVATGWTFGARIGTNYQVSPAVSFGLDGGVSAATNGTVVRSGGILWANRFEQRSQQPPGAQQWGDLGAHLTVGLSDSLALSASAGTTVGLDAEQTYGSAGMTFSF